MEDRWRWGLEESGMFSVKSTYGKLEAVVVREDLWSVEEKGVFAKLWKSPAPSKVVAFSWKLLYDRIPTRVNLLVRNVLPTDASHLCTLCGRGEESSIHPFLHCEVAGRVWRDMMGWWESFIVIPPNLFILWECWCGGERKKSIRRGLRLIWHATIWVLWKARNDKIFNNRNLVVDIVEDIKVVTWWWSLEIMAMSPCMFYEWCWNPRDCLSRLC